MLDALYTMLNISNEFRDRTRDYIFKIAQEREKDQDPDDVIEFWHLFEFLEEGTKAQINHSIDQDLIAINLNEFVEIARNRGSNIGDVSLFCKLLPHSKRYEFIDNKNVYSRYAKKVVLCYVLKRESGK